MMKRQHYVAWFQWWGRRWWIWWPSCWSTTSEWWSLSRISVLVIDAFLFRSQHQTVQERHSIEQQFPINNIHRIRMSVRPSYRRNHRISIIPPSRSKIHLFSKLIHRITHMHRQQLRIELFRIHRGIRLMIHRHYQSVRRPIPVSTTTPVNLH